LREGDRVAADISRVNGEDGFVLGRIVAADHGRRSGGQVDGHGGVGADGGAGIRTGRGSCCWIVSGVNSGWSVGGGSPKRAVQVL
jgi:hypothetical protein